MSVGNALGGWNYEKKKLPIIIIICNSNKKGFRRVVHAPVAVTF
jgi:hypothetical protein